MEVSSWKSGRRHLKCQPSSRTGENPPYGMIGGIEETSASFEARYAPRSYPTRTAEQRDWTMRSRAFARPVGIAGRAPHRVRDTSDVLSLPCGDLPAGRFVERGVQPPLQKYFGFHTPQITSRTLRIPSHTEGRFAIVTDVGYGMRWTRQRFARDGIAGRVLLNP